MTTRRTWGESDLMDFSEFVSGYRAGTVVAHVDRSRAMRVCGNSPALPRRYRTTHLIWKNVSLFLVLGGLVSLLWVSWWAGLGAVVLGLVIAPAVQKSAAQFVLQYSLEDEAFFRQMQADGVLTVERISASS
jgi:hypothetical protein